MAANSLPDLFESNALSKNDIFVNGNVRIINRSDFEGGQSSQNRLWLLLEICLP